MVSIVTLRAWRLAVSLALVVGEAFGLGWEDQRYPPQASGYTRTILWGHEAVIR